jgi:hypothetical protein
MSIALEARVTELEKEVMQLQREVTKQTMLKEGAPFLPRDFLQLLRRVEALEQARKPGPKPKDANG